MEGIKRIFSIHGLIFAKARCIPFKWNIETQRFYLYQHPEAEFRQQSIEFDRQHQSIQRNLHIITTLVLIGQQALPASHENWASKILNFLALAILPVYSIHLLVSQTKCEEIVCYINGLLEFLERMQPHLNVVRRKFTEKVNILLALGLAPSALIIPAGYVFGLHWLHPYDKKSLVGFWLLGNIETSFKGIMLKFLVLIFNYWIWTIGIVAGVCCVGSIGCLSTILLRDCIRAFRQLECNPGSVNFEERAKLYRSIQILGNLQTEVNSGILTAILIFNPIMALSMTIVVINHLPWTANNATVILLCAYIALNAFIAIIFLVGLQAGVWSESKSLLEKLAKLILIRQGVLQRLELKLQKQFWKSCRNLIKVKFGANNFIEDETTLNCLNCAISFTAQLLLLKR